MDVSVTEVATAVHHARAKHVSWVLVTEGEAVTVVDTGYPGDRDRLSRSLGLVGRTAGDVEGVVLTHGHPDHIGSAAHLRTTHGIPVWAHRDEAPNALELFAERQLDLPGGPVVVHTPGHTSGHCSLHLSERAALLAGNALMTGHALERSEGPQLLPDFFHKDPAQARASLEHLRQLSADVVVPGHGPTFAWTSTNFRR